MELAINPASFFTRTVFIYGLTNHTREPSFMNFTSASMKESKKCGIDSSQCSIGKGRVPNSRHIFGNVIHVNATRVI
jgi:hypothetical protein